MLLTCFSSPSYFFVGYTLIFLHFSWGVLSGLVITLVNSKTVAWIIGCLDHKPSTLFKNTSWYEWAPTWPFLLRFFSISHAQMIYQTSGQLGFCGTDAKGLGLVLTSTRCLFLKRAIGTPAFSLLFQAM